MGGASHIGSGEGAVPVVDGWHGNKLLARLGGMGVGAAERVPAAEGTICRHGKGDERPATLRPSLGVGASEPPEGGTYALRRPIAMASLTWKRSASSPSSMPSPSKCAGVSTIDAGRALAFEEILDTSPTHESSSRSVRANEKADCERARAVAHSSTAERGPPAAAAAASSSALCISATSPSASSSLSRSASSRSTASARAASSSASALSSRSRVRRSSIVVASAAARSSRNVRLSSTTCASAWLSRKVASVECIS
mmetsp:Transcript_12212/g.33490  ORF Transcript_12212/g.33490 Transcript_12212/m.33490 type:complete len:256 (-) Transcript_12212:464-1231(-)